MKIINYEGGRVTWLFPIEEFGKLGGVIIHSLVAAIVARYNFQTSPPSLLPEQVNVGMKFGLGQFKFKGELVHIGEFGIYSDGIAAGAAKTDRAEAFLEDMVAWLQREFDFRNITTPIKKISSSNLVFEFDFPIEKVLNPKQQLSSIVSKALGEMHGINRVAVLTRLDFQLDRPIEERTNNPIRFTLELRNGAAPGQNRYFSSAPISTDEHEAALIEIEASLANL